MNASADRSDEHLALTRELWPQVNAKSLIPVGDGWTCDTYEVDGRWIVQFPRSSYAEETLRQQMAALPLLAHRLPARIPEPIPPRPSQTVAMLYPRIDGQPFPDAPGGRWPEALGRLLRELQSIAPDEIEVPSKSTPELRAERAVQLRMMAERVLPLVPGEFRQAIEPAFGKFIDDDRLWQFGPVLVHGDLGPPHILVDSRGGLAGVIDWEEIALGDPASDFAWLVHEKPEIGERVVNAAASDQDQGWPERARFIYVQMPFHEVIHGLETGQQLFVELGVRGIQQRAKLL